MRGAADETRRVTKPDRSVYLRDLRDLRVSVVCVDYSVISVPSVNHGPPKNELKTQT
jgi:hypothetical protein